MTAFESIFTAIAAIISVVMLITALLTWNDVLETDREICEMIRQHKHDDGANFWTE